MRVEELLVDLNKLIDEGGGGGSVTPEDELSDADVDDIMSVISTDNDEDESTDSE